MNALLNLLKDLWQASLLLKIIFGILTIAAFCMAIAFTCTGWIENESGLHWGLWRMCSDVHYITTGCSFLDGTANDWWALTQAFTIFGFVGIYLSYIMIIMTIFVEKYKDGIKLKICSAILSTTTGALMVIGLVIFGVNYHMFYYNKNHEKHWLSYAYVFGVMSNILEIVAGVFLVIEAKLSIKHTITEMGSTVTHNDFQVQMPSNQQE